MIAMNLSWIEVVGAAASIVGIWLTIKANVWCWLVNIGGASLYAVVFFQEHLYASTALQIVYALLGVYGWYTWTADSHRNDHANDTRADIRRHSAPSDPTEPQQPFVRSLPMLTLLGLLCGVILISAVVSAVLVRTTQAEFAIVDTCLSGISLLATWMTARKYVENWLLWVGANVCYVILFGAKSLWLTVGLYAMLCIMAMIGYRQWMMQYQQTTSVAEPPADAL